jgi:hypothetical protein
MGDLSSKYLPKGPGEKIKNVRFDDQKSTSSLQDGKDGDVKTTWRRTGEPRLRMATRGGLMKEWRAAGLGESGKAPRVGTSSGLMADDTGLFALNIAFEPIYALEVIPRGCHPRYVVLGVGIRKK